tara:strand:- start:62 stop:985 length:924 start_codon:yes stop_codon:yes gene_type:complete
MQILIIQPKIGMGDMVIYLPYIHAISKKYKKSVSLLVKDNSRARELLADDNHINEIITLKKEMDGIGGIFQLSKELKKRNFDKIFIFNSSLRYHLVARLAGIREIYQYPLFKSKDNIVISAKIFTETITNQIVSTEPSLIIKKKDNNLDRSYKHICLGISASGPTKKWDINNYIRLAEKINKEKKCKFYIAGGKNDIDLINKFQNSSIGADSLSFENMKIKETLKYISDCDLYIGNDTGWAHISVALDVKALTIFCDSPVAAYGSYSSKMITIEPEGVLKGSTTHDTLGKDKISFNEVYNQSIRMLN